MFRLSSLTAHDLSGVPIRDPERIEGADEWTRVDGPARAGGSCLGAWGGLAGLAAEGGPLVITSTLARAGTRMGWTREKTWLLVADMWSLPEGLS